MNIDQVRLTSDFPYGGELILMTIAQHNLNWAAQRAQCRTRDEVHCYRSDKPNHSANKLDRAAARLRTMRGAK